MVKDLAYLIYGLVVLGMAACGEIRGVHPVATWLDGDVWDPEGNRPTAAGVWHK
jgi:hypothetical protein